MPRSQLSFGLAACLLLCCAFVRAGEREFSEAVAMYRKGDISGAYGRFFALANSGDVDAARITLFMHRYGPTLYRSNWDASQDELESWTQMASFSMGRPATAFRRIPAESHIGKKRGPVRAVKPVQGDSQRGTKAQALR